MKMNLTKNRLVTFSVASLFAGLVYWLTLSQGTKVAGALAVTVFAAILWITEVIALAVTALLIPVGLAAFGIFSPNTAFFSFANPVIFLVLGGYTIAVALEVNQVDRWIAHHILGIAGNRSIALVITFMLTSALLSTVISNTAATALLLPVALGTLSQHKADDNFRKIIFLGIAYGASIGGVATLIGSPPNAIAAGLLGISFLEWLAYGIPVSLTMLVVAIPILYWTYPPREKHFSFDLGERISLTTQGKRTLQIATTILLMWLFGPGIATQLGLPVVLFSSASVAMIGIVLLILSDCVNWKNMETGVQWGVLLLLGGGLSLGRGLTESGAADWLAALLAVEAGNLSLFVLMLVIVGIGVFATELISNTAVTAKLAPIIMGLGLQLGLDSENLVVSMSIATSMAFMLPVATPPNAMVHASRQVLQKDMIKVGIRLNFAAISVITVVFYFGIAG